MTYLVVQGLKVPIRSQVEVQGLANAARLVIAVQRHRLRHGAWPEAIERIDGDLLIDRPVDPYTGRGFGYRYEDTGPVVWSAGEDRDDDGGRARRGGHHIWTTPEELAQRLIDNPTIDGDWVIYPPAHQD